MEADRKILDRQVGRNAQLFAESIGRLEDRERRYPYLRILISVIEQAHPEWNQAPQKDTQIGQLIRAMSRQTLALDEVAEVVRVRDEERGFGADS